METQSFAMVETKAVYKFRSGWSSPIPAQTIGEVREMLQQRYGDVIPNEAVVEFAAPEDSPFHIGFPWDNEECGRLVRLRVAGDLMRSVVRVAVAAEEPSDTGRAEYWGMGSTESGGCTMAKAVVLSDEELIYRKLVEVIATLKGYAKTYGDDLVYLSPVWRAIRNIKLPPKPDRSTEPDD